MAISDRFNIDYVAKRIYHNGTNSCWWTVNALYSYLQDTFDELDQMDDPIPMSAQTPTDYTIINGWFIPEGTFQYLKGGAIKTVGWTSGVIRMMSYDATGAGTGFASNDIGQTITTTTNGYTGIVLSYDERYATETGVVWIRPTTTSDLFTANEAFTMGGTGTAAGSITLTFYTAHTSTNTGENLYSNVYTLGTIQENDNQQIYIVQNSTTLTSWWPEFGSTTQHIDVLIKVREAGNLTDQGYIDSGYLSIYLRHYPDSSYGDLYDHFIIDVSPGGRNAVPLATQDDLNNTTYATTIYNTVSDVVIAFVNGTITHNTVYGGSFTNYEIVTWTGNALGGIMMLDSSGSMTIGNVQGTNPASGNTIYNSTGAVTTTASANMTEAYTINKAFDQQTDKPYTVVVQCANRQLSVIYEYFKFVTRETSTFQTYPITKSSGGVLSHTAQDGEHYIRAYVDNQGSGSYTPIKASPFGTFAGGKLFAAQGVWLEGMASSDIQAFQLIDASGNTVTPPNKQVIAVTNLKQNDRVTVFRTTTAGSADINKSLYTSTTTNTAGRTRFIVSATIDTDTPSTGTLRTVDDTDGSEERYTYTSFSGSTFYLQSTLLGDYNTVQDTAYVPYIDQTVGATTAASVTVIYPNKDRGLLIRVRRKTTTPILPFEAQGTFGSTGFSIATIRTEDTIVN